MGHRLLSALPAPRGPARASPQGSPLAAKSAPAEQDAFVLMLSLTNACNLACAHCYREESRAFPSELEGFEVVRVLREFAALAASEGRPGAVVFSGGEPLLARHLGLFARTAAGLGLGARINTNGILATPAAARGLYGWGVRHAQVSLDGCTPAEHEAVRGPRTWALTREGVRNLLGAGIEVVLKVTLLPGRNDRDPAGYLRVAASWGVARVDFARAVPLGAGGGLGHYTPRAYRATLERLAAGRDLPERSSQRGAAGRKDGRGPCRDRPGVVAEIRDATFDRSYLTGDRHGYVPEEGRSILAVDADGTCFASRRMPLVLGNVRELSLADLWAHPALVAMRESGLHGKCASCGLLETCRGGSRAAAWSATGDPLAPDPGCPVGVAKWQPARRRRSQAPVEVKGSADPGS